LLAAAASAADPAPARYYRLKGDSDHAIADYTQAIEINPRYANAYFNRGSIFQTKGAHDGAIADFTKAIEITPRNTGAFYHRGLAHRAKGEIDQAIVDFTNAIDGFVGCAVRRHDRAASLMSPALPS
jgi:tetratricopeptide (TPR) repeat protein